MCKEAQVTVRCPGMQSRIRALGGDKSQELGDHPSPCFYLLGFTFMFVCVCSSVSTGRLLVSGMHLAAKIWPFFYLADKNASLSGNSDLGGTD